MDVIPDNEADLLKRIYEAQRGGPPALMQLMVLCYWLNGQRTNYLAYVDGHKTVHGDRRIYLLQLLTELKKIPRLSSDQFQAFRSPRPKLNNDAAQLLTEIVALHGIEAPEGRLSDQTRLLYQLLMMKASALVPEALEHIRTTCLDPRWTFKYRLRLAVLVDVLWMAREEHSLAVFNFIASLLIEEAKAGMSVRIEPGPGIVSIELLSLFVTIWCDPKEAQRTLTQIQTWI